MPQRLRAPDDAPNEGARALRVIMLTKSTGEIARKVGSLASTVLRWSIGVVPDPESRGRVFDTLRIPPESWSKSLDAARSRVKPLEAAIDTEER